MDVGSYAHMNLSQILLLILKELLKLTLRDQRVPKCHRTGIRTLNAAANYKVQASPSK